MAAVRWFQGTGVPMRSIDRGSRCRSALSAAALAITCAAPPAVVSAAPAPDGNWLVIPPSVSAPARANFASAYDTRRHRFVVVGDANHIDLWSLGFGSFPNWDSLTATGTPPVPRIGATAVYDSAADRLLLFGGLHDGILLDSVDVVSFAGLGPTWSVLATSGTPPPPRWMHDAILDPRRHRMLVFGGQSETSIENDVWQLTLDGIPAWSRLETTGATPAPRYAACAAYDAGSDAVVVFSGHNGGIAGLLEDTWALDLSSTPTWREVHGPHPDGRWQAGATYDSRRGATLVFGGLSSVSGADSSEIRDDVWKLDLRTGSWTEIGGGVPGGRRCSSFGLCYDDLGDQLVVFGGASPTGNIDLTVGLDLSNPISWTRLTPRTVPAPRRESTAVLDSAGGRIILFGGVLASRSITNETWILSTGATVWTKSTAGPVGPSLAGHAAVWDPLRSRMLAVGGGFSPDVWAFSPDLGWSRPLVIGDTPGSRSRPGMIYDPIGDRLILFGGRGVTRELGDLWELPLAAGSPLSWSMIAPGGDFTPPPMSGFTMTYDAARRRAIVFGGNSDGSLSSFVWSLDLTVDPPAWSLISPGGTAPEARWQQSGVIDAANHRLLVLGGQGLRNTFSDMWELTIGDAPAWRQLAPTGPPLGTRVLAPAVYDAADTRVWMFGGFDGAHGTYLGDTRVLNLDRTTGVLVSLAGADAAPDRVDLRWDVPGASRVQALVERRIGSEAWLRLGTPGLLGRDRLEFEDRAVEAGATYEYRLEVTFEDGSRFDSDVTVRIPRLLGFGLAGVHPNPAVGDGRVTFSLPDAAPARIDVLDAGGRRLGSMAVGALGAGTHTLPLPFDRRPAPGLCFIRLSRGGESRVAKWAIVN